MAWIKIALIFVFLNILPSPSSGCPKTVKIQCPCGNHGKQSFVSIDVKVFSFASEKSKIERCRTFPKAVRDACESYKNCEECPIAGTDVECHQYPDNSRFKRKIWYQTAYNQGYPNFVVKPGKQETYYRIARQAENEDPKNPEEPSNELGEAQEPLEPSNELEAPSVPDQAGAKPGEEEEDFEACEVYVDLETAEIKCTMYPTYISCLQSCLSGYEIDGSQFLKTRCFYKNPLVWIPTRLDECKHVRNCYAKLVTPGSLKCTVGTVDNPVCYIRCQPYDDLPYVPLQSYECKGEYEPPLPHCAVIDTEYEPKGEK